MLLFFVLKCYYLQRFQLPSYAGVCIIMEKKLNESNSRMFRNYRSAMKNLEEASKIAMKLGIYPGDIDKMKKKEIKALRNIFLKR